VEFISHLKVGSSLKELVKSKRDMGRRSGIKGLSEMLRNNKALNVCGTYSTRNGKRKGDGNSRRKKREWNRHSVSFK
jgi:hypothetical protein